MNYFKAGQNRWFTILSLCLFSTIAGGLVISYSLFKNIETKLMTEQVHDQKILMALFELEDSGLHLIMLYYEALSTKNPQDLISQLNEYQQKMNASYNSILSLQESTSKDPIFEKTYINNLRDLGDSVQKNLQRHISFLILKQNEKSNETWLVAKQSLRTYIDQLHHFKTLLDEKIFQLNIQTRKTLKYFSYTNIIIYLFMFVFMIIVINQTRKKLTSIILSKVLETKKEFEKIFSDPVILELETDENLENFAKRFDSLMNKLLKNTILAETYRQGLNGIMGTSVWDINGKLLECNHDFEKIISLQNKSSLTMKKFMGDFSQFDTIMMKISTGIAWRGEYTFKVNNTDTLYDLTFVPAKSLNNKNAITGILLLAIDITLKKRTEEQIMANAQMSSLGDMATSMAHEINNPITIISSTIKVIHKLIEKNRITPEILEQYLADIDRSAQRITKLIRTLITMTGPQCPNEKLSIEYHCLSSIYEETFILIEEKLKCENISIEKVGDDSIWGLNIPLCKNDMTQIFFNIISNSIDAISTQSDKWIKIVISIQEKTLILDFIDSGLGIPHNVQKKMFNMLFSTKEKSSGKGTGIGLGLAKSKIEKMGGSIYYVENNKNTTFRLELPIKGHDGADDKR